MEKNAIPTDGELFSPHFGGASHFALFTFDREQHQLLDAESVQAPAHERGVFPMWLRKSGATIVPCFFTGANSRWYQMANRISPVLRQGLLIHEVVHSFDKPQAPVIGTPVGPDEWESRIGKPREFMAWLRERTLSLKDGP